MNQWLEFLHYYPLEERRCVPQSKIDHPWDVSAKYGLKGSFGLIHFFYSVVFISPMNVKFHEDLLSSKFFQLGPYVGKWPIVIDHPFI
jgi:hypothetical protein